MARIEFVPFPPTSFPFRDLLVLEQLPLGVARHVCEIGVGSGETTARLARVCWNVTGFDVSGPAIDSLRYLERRHANLKLIVADVTDERALAAYAGRFDCAVSCDTLEHVGDPAGFFRGLGTLLAPGGRLAVTFPNEPRPKMHGVTRFDRPRDLDALMAAAGFGEVRLGAARLTPHAERVARSLGWRPLALARRLVAAARALARAARGDRDAHEEPPQTFEQTRFFRDRRVWRALSPAINLYWFAVLRLMAARGPSFAIDWDFRATPFDECQVFVIGRKRGRSRLAA
jgi:SAM-dependent methyltransferase